MSRWVRQFLVHAGLVLLFYQAFPTSAAPLRLLVLGDSLTAGYGLPKEQGFTARLEQRLKSQGFDVVVVNAGVSGDTTAGGLARLGWVLQEPPDAVLVELGANDMLRGLPPEQAEKNLDALLSRLRDSRLPVLLIGFRASTNLGADYAAAFDSLYPRLARKHEAALYPFFLDGVAMKSDLNQEDGLHPNAKGVDIIVNRILPYVARLLKAGKERLP